MVCGDGCGFEDCSFVFLNVNSACLDDDVGAWNVLGVESQIFACGSLGGKDVVFLKLNLLFLDGGLGFAVFFEVKLGVFGR